MKFIPTNSKSHGSDRSHLTTILHNVRLSTTIKEPQTVLLLFSIRCLKYEYATLLLFTNAVK